MVQWEEVQDDFKDDLIQEVQGQSNETVSHEIPGVPSEAAMFHQAFKKHNAKILYCWIARKTMRLKSNGGTMAVRHKSIKGEPTRVPPTIHWS